MTTEIARVPAGIVPLTIDDLERAIRLVGPASALKLIVGQAAGLSIGQCLTDVHLMQANGAIRPTLSATAQLALARNAGVRTRWVERTDEAAALEITPPGQQPSVWRVTMDDARKAGWSTGKNSGTWAAHPGAMLRARAITRAIRAECPEVLGGMSLYDPDELRSEGATETVTVHETSRPAIEQRRTAAVIDAQPEAKPAPGALTVEQRRTRAVDALCRNGITREHLEARVSAPVDAWESVHLTQLGADLAALRKGTMSPAEYIALCAPPPDAEPEPADLADADLSGELGAVEEPAPQTTTPAKGRKGAPV